MDSLYQEELEKEISKKEANISLDDEGIMKVLMCCHAGRSCKECPYDELNSPRCRDILLNECIGLINRLKQAKVDVAREIFEEIEVRVKLSLELHLEALNTDYDWHSGIVFILRKIDAFIAELKKKYTEEITEGEG